MGNLDVIFLFSQLLALAAFLLGGLSFQLKERRLVLLCWSASALANSAHFICLGLTTPAVITAITGSRFLLASRSSSRAMYYFFIIASLAAGYLTYERPLNLIPTASSLIGTTAVFFASNVWMRILLGICSILWLAHNWIAGSPVAVAMEAVFLTSNLVGFLRLRKRLLAIREVKQTGAAA